ncbi:MAG: molybdopterin-dependent oxidoreductase, partial [Gammaproteobacteria bacterium]
HGACPHDCPDTCAWEVTVDDAGRAVALAGSADHPFTRGALCAKLKRYPERVYSDARVLYPLRRTGPKGSGRFERIDWDEAIALISGKLTETIARHGPLAALPCSFAGTIGLLNRYAGDYFFSHLGATGLDRRICGNVAFDAVTATLGVGTTLLPEDLAHSRYILIWGTNTAATNVHLWGGAIRAARRAGARVVVVDPVRTPTAAHADWHLQITPGTDAALALGVAHVILRDALHDADYVARHTEGFDAFSARAAEYPPARVAAITGIAAADVEQLAREYATTRPAALRMLVGMERYSNGGASVRAVACLPALIGAWRELGGGLSQFTNDLFYAALDTRVVMPGDDAPQPARTVHLAQLGRALTEPTMAPPITWMLVYNLNPVVTLPAQNRIVEGLLREDLFTVVHEQFMTDTARYADVVLPATTQFEHWELMPSWSQTYLALNPPAIAPLGEAIPNTELFRRLSRALGYTAPELLSSDEARIRALLASGSPLLDGITFESLLEQGWAPLRLPHDFRPRAEGGFTTPSGKVELYSATLAARGLDPLPGYVPLADDDDASARWPLRLVSAKVAEFLNSEYVNLPLRGTARRTPHVDINPHDAAARAIADGDPVRLYNALGAVETHARVSGSTAPGVVSLPFGWWMSSTLNGASANALTPDGLSDHGFGSNAFDARVEICRIGAPG